MKWCHTHTHVPAIALSPHPNTISARAVFMFAAHDSVALISGAGGPPPQSLVSTVQLFRVCTVVCGVEGGTAAGIFHSRVLRRCLCLRWRGNRAVQETTYRGAS